MGMVLIKWRSRMNILIIDDDKDLLRLLELTFKKEYNVVPL